MGQGEELPLLHAGDLRARRRLFGLAIFFGLCALSLILVESCTGAVSRATDGETYKLLLQFFLITAGGGAFLAIVGNAQNEARQRQERATSIQALDRELDRAYRALKKTKRRLRAHDAQLAGVEAPASRDVGPYKIPRDAFEKGMDDLLQAQLELETICDHIGHRNDILAPKRLKRMEAPLRYASGYYHDVHEDFEKGRVRLDDENNYDLSSAPNLANYLRSSHRPPERGEAFRTALNKLKTAETLEERAKGVEELLAASPTKTGTEESRPERHKIHYADAAAACFDLLAAELADVRRNLLS